MTSVRLYAKIVVTHGKKKKQDSNEITTVFRNFGNDGYRANRPKTNIC